MVLINVFANPLLQVLDVARSFTQTDEDNKDSKEAKEEEKDKLAIGKVDVIDVIKCRYDLVDILITTGNNPFISSLYLCIR